MNRKILFSWIAVFLTSSTFAQSDLLFEQIPGYENYRKVISQRRDFASVGRVSDTSWSADGKFLSYTAGGKKLVLNLENFAVEATSEKPGAAPRPDRPNRRTGTPVARAMQRTVEPSPDGKWNAVYRDGNVWIEPIADDGEKIQVTTDGTERIRFGTCCWVYGEELDQKEAMWWSPDNRKLVYYKVDETGMKDYYLTLDNAAMYTTLQAVRYPKAGDDNPRINLWVYDLDSKKSQQIEFDGDPTQYLFNVRFTPKGNEVLVNRTNRRQDVLDVLAVDVTTLKVRAVVTERQETWQENSPIMRFLADGERFVWGTEANGWRHFQLRHLDGRLLNLLSEVHEYPCDKIELIDEADGLFYYSAFSDENPYNSQLHRVRLDGTDHRRLTSFSLNHTSYDIAPNHKFVMSTRERFDIPPSTAVYDDNGRQVAVLTEGTDEAASGAGFAPTEMFSFTANDGKTQIYGTLSKPSNFDPSKKYPLLIDVYGGPQSQGLSNRYSPANPVCEMGYVVAKIGNRGTVGRGKAFECATYLYLGDRDMADQADGVKYLRQRPYIDGDRVGIYGHSYGGYMSALALVKYPDVFHVAVSGAPVTDWKNYDTIYTERYMRTPEENPDGYKNGSCMPHAGKLAGKLLIVHGLIDDNVHPSNTWQLAKAFHTANKRFDMMIYSEFQHGIGSTYESLKWEYFYRHLHPEVSTQPAK